jgi:hypothetical protein
LLINAPCRNNIKSLNPLIVIFPSGETMNSTQIASLGVPELSETASVPQHVCCYVTFRIDGVRIFNSGNKYILKGHRDLGTGLWCINLGTDKPHIKFAEANNVYELRNTGKLLNYLHKTMSSPNKSALLQAVRKGHITTCPGLTEVTINKHLKMMPVTAMGHMNQKRQNSCSTKNEIMSDLEDETVTPVSSGLKIHLAYAMVIDQGQIYTDLNGRFSARSSKGNWYVMVCYSYDCNYVKPVPMTSNIHLNG